MQTLEQFLADVEKRAYRMARLATRNDADALDIVQDAMISLVSHYGEKPEAQWRPLFFKVLENRIMDWHRKETVKRKWFVWNPFARQEEDEDPALEVEDETANPLLALANQQLGERLLEMVEGFPLKQQQCFLLRCWEGLSVAETAQAMSINEGSVKTHYSRAMQKLQAVLQDHQHD